jgi:hypothetical protein
VREIESWPNAEVEEWRIWESINGPLGAARGDFQSANISMMLAAVNSTRRRRLKIWDFLPFRLAGLGPRKAQTQEDQIALLKQMSAAVKRRAKHG